MAALSYGGSGGFLNSSERSGDMRKDGRLPVYWKIILIVLPALAALVALCIGRMAITPGEVAEALAAGVSGGQNSEAGVGIPEMVYKTVWNLRLPRIILAMLVGAGLSVAGCAFQSLFANPLATPDTLGVASGASFGAALGILLGFGMIGIQATALVMGAAAVCLTWLAGSGKSHGMGYIVLAGIMIGSLFNALVSLTKYVADEESQLPAITYWLMGGLDKASFRTLAMGAGPIIIGVAVLWLLRWKLNILPLSDDEARAAGVDVRRLRGVTILCATLITASAVSMCGQVGWVGLLIPHMCRMMFGNNHMAIVPASVSIGATFMIAVDTVARSVSASEIPISILTAVIGAPFFIILMRRSEGWRL